jgi:hypothetical protein
MPTLCCVPTRSVYTIKLSTEECENPFSPFGSAQGGGAEQTPPLANRKFAKQRGFRQSNALFTDCASEVRVSHSAGFDKRSTDLTQKSGGSSCSHAERGKEELSFWRGKEVLSFWRGKEVLSF